MYAKHLTLAYLKLSCCSYRKYNVVINYVKIEDSGVYTSIHYYFVRICFCGINLLYVFQLFERIV